MAKFPATTRAGPNRAGLRRTPPPAAVAQPPAEKAGAEPEPQARTQPPEQPRAEEPRPVAVAAPVAAPPAVVAVPVAAVPARVEVVDVVDPVIQDSTVVDTAPVPGVHPVGDDVLIRDAEVMRHLGPVQAAVAPETSRPGVHARKPPRIVKRWPVVERGPEVRGPAVEAGPGSSEPADRAAVEPAIHRRRHPRGGEVRGGEVSPAAVEATAEAAAVEAAAVEAAAEAAVAVGVAVARQGQQGRERRREESLVHDPSSSVACSGWVRSRFTSTLAGERAAP
jgi:hypothetical protein